MKIKLKTQNVWFTSDTHFSHANVIKYDNRPFSSIEEHDRALIDNWNSVVDESDYVFLIGDFAFNNHAKIKSRLKGKIILVRGNHDKCLIPRCAAYDMVDLQVLDPEFAGDSKYQHLVLLHYPIMQEWNKAHYGSFHLYGHTHGGSPVDEHLMRYRALNVGTMLHDYRPISYAEVKDKLKSRLVVTHH